MRRVVITGMGVVSCLGNNKEEVTSSLRQGRSGLRFNSEYERMGLRCHVAGSVVGVDFAAHIAKRDLRFMGRAAALACVAMKEAIADAGLSQDEISSPRTGCVLGAGGTDAVNIIQGNEILKSKGVRRIGPYRVTSTMSSSVSGCLSTAFGIRGLNYSLTSACSTSAHCIGHAYEQIAWGKQDIIFAGGGEKEHYTESCLFDAMGAFSTRFNATPAAASRPYDCKRDGFVISEGGGVLVLEEFERARARGAQMYGEIVGYAATSDGADMVVPSGEGGTRAMKLALETVRAPVGYVNTHGTSTPIGDITELNALREVFGQEVPPLSSTKSLSGHALGAAGAHEAIYCLLMMRHHFLAASANIESLDPQAEGFPIIRETRHAVVDVMMSNSFGFGGTNAVLVFQRV